MHSYFLLYMSFVFRGRLAALVLLMSNTILKIDSIYRLGGHLSEIVNPKRDMKVWLLCQPPGNRIDGVRRVRGWIDKFFDNDDIVRTISLKLVKILMDRSDGTALWWTGKRTEGGREGRGGWQNPKGKGRKGAIADKHLISITEYCRARHSESNN
jgi:hypothetical protein